MLESLSFDTSLSAFGLIKKLREQNAFGLNSQELAKKLILTTHGETYLLSDIASLHHYEAANLKLLFPDKEGKTFNCVTVKNNIEDDEFTGKLLHNQPLAELLYELDNAGEDYIYPGLSAKPLKPFSVLRPVITPTEKTYEGYALVDWINFLSKKQQNIVHPYPDHNIPLSKDFILPNIALQKLSNSLFIEGQIERLSLGKNKKKVKKKRLDEVYDNYHLAYVAKEIALNDHLTTLLNELSVLCTQIDTYPTLSKSSYLKYIFEMGNEIIGQLIQNFRHLKRNFGQNLHELRTRLETALSSIQTIAVMFGSYKFCKSVNYSNIQSACISAAITVGALPIVVLTSFFCIFPTMNFMQGLLDQCNQLFDFFDLLKMQHDLEISLQKARTNLEEIKYEIENLKCFQVENKPIETITKNQSNFKLFSNSASFFRQPLSEHIFTEASPALSAKMI